MIYAQRPQKGGEFVLSVNELEFDDIHDLVNAYLSGPSWYKYNAARVKNEYASLYFILASSCHILDDMQLSQQEAAYVFILSVGLASEWFKHQKNYWPGSDKLTRFIINQDNNELYGLISSISFTNDRAIDTTNLLFSYDIGEKKLTIDEVKWLYSTGMPAIAGSNSKAIRRAVTRIMDKYCTSFAEHCILLSNSLSIELSDGKMGKFILNGQDINSIKHGSIIHVDDSIKRFFILGGAEDG